MTCDTTKDHAALQSAEETLHKSGISCVSAEPALRSVSQTVGGAGVQAPVAARGGEPVQSVGLWSSPALRGAKKVQRKKFQTKSHPQSHILGNKHFSLNATWWV